MRIHRMWCISSFLSHSSRGAYFGGDGCNSCIPVVLSGSIAIGNQYHSLFRGFRIKTISAVIAAIMVGYIVINLILSDHRVLYA